MIIDHLWDDQRNLQACSLTCHAWLPSARVHLFHSVVFRREEDFHRLEHVLESPAPSPHLLAFTQYVKCITFSKSKWHMYRRDAVGWLDEKLPHSLACFHNVRTLHLSYWDSQDVSDRVVEDLIAFFPKMTTLYFTEVGLDPRHHLRLLRGFPCLAGVSVIGTIRGMRAMGMIDPSEEEELQDSKVHLCEEDAIRRLDALHLHRSPDCLLIAACLLQQPFQLSVRKLSLEWTYVKAYAIPYAAALLRATATTLEHLRVSFQLMLANISALIPAALEPLRHAALTSLYIGRLDLPPPWRIRSSEFTWVPALLIRVEPTRLRSVTFGLRLFSSDIGPLPWSEIDTQLTRLARARPLGLHVTFEMSCDGHMLLRKEATDAVLHRLPMLRTCLNVAVEVARLIDRF